VETTAVTAPKPHVTREFFNDEYLQFREMMGNRNTTVDELETAFRTLFWLSIQVEDDRKGIETVVRAAGDEMMKRIPYFLLKGLRGHGQA
jgi:hypothetical protein